MGETRDKKERESRYISHLPTLDVEPGVELFGGGEDLREEEVEQRPQLVQVVLLA